jgi:hypothetical protein
MMLHRSLRRSAAIAAAFAILLQALWPLLSHARPTDQLLLAPICAIDGVVHSLEIKTGRTPLEERSASHGEHCKLCVFGDGKAALNAVVDLDSSFRVASHKVVTPQRSFPKQLRLPSAHPRAPPAAA